MSAALPPRPLDPVVSQRVDDVQRAAFRAAGGVELVWRHLCDHNCEEIGGLSVAVLADALELVQRELSGITDGLDSVRLCRVDLAQVERLDS